VFLSINRFDWFSLIPWYICPSIHRSRGVSLLGFFDSTVNSEKYGSRRPWDDYSERETSIGSPGKNK
jgi:hypothetical protein